MSSLYTFVDHYTRCQLPTLHKMLLFTPSLVHSLPSLLIPSLPLAFLTAIRAWKRPGKTITYSIICSCVSSPLQSQEVAAVVAGSERRQSPAQTVVARSSGHTSSRGGGRGVRVHLGSIQTIATLELQCTVATFIVSKVHICLYTLHMHTHSPITLQTPRP